MTATSFATTATNFITTTIITITTTTITSSRNVSTTTINPFAFNLQAHTAVVVGIVVRCLVGRKAYRIHHLLDLLPIILNYYYHK